MPQQPDLRFDIDALFEHLTDNLDHRPDEEFDWQFDLRAEDFAALGRVAESLADEFDVMLQEEVETFENGRWFKGPPMLSIGVSGALTPAEVKSLAARFAALAAEHGFTYDGVSCCEPIDEDEMFGWLDLEEATWRLRNFSDTGLPTGAPMPWVFAVAGPDDETVDSAAKALEKLEAVRLERVDHEDGPLLLVHCEGRNDEQALSKMFAEVERAAAAAGAEVIGVQFFEEDDGEEGDDEDADFDDEDDEEDEDEN